MPYMDETGLAYYSGKLKPWIASQPVKTLPSSLYPWTLTEKAGAVTCWPVGGTPLLPTVNFQFTETPPADGQPKSPTNPSTITGVSSITVTRCEIAGVDSTDYTIDLGGTCYGGSIDLATGVMTVTHSRLVYDGTEAVSVAGSGSIHYYFFNAYHPLIKNATAFTSTHFNVSNIGSAFAMCSYSNTEQTRFGWTAGAYSYWESTAALQSWLASQYAAGTPLTIVYELATPYTVQLSPTEILSLTQADKYTPRLNTVYTDASSVQVGYVKSPIREEFELQQAIVAQGGSV